MKIKSQRDFWSGLMFIAVGMAFAVGATNYTHAARRPGPGARLLSRSVLSC